MVVRKAGGLVAGVRFSAPRQFLNSPELVARVPRLHPAVAGSMTGRDSPHPDNNKTPLARGFMVLKNFRQWPWKGCAGRG